MLLKFLRLASEHDFEYLWGGGGTKCQRVDKYEKDDLLFHIFCVSVPHFCAFSEKGYGTNLITLYRFYLESKTR